MRAGPALVLLALLGAGCTGPEPPGQEPGTEPTSEPGSRGGYLDLEEPGATRCTGTLGAEEVPGDLRVPEGRTCRLEGTAVAGRTSVGRDASLVATDARFGEGISAHAYRRVVLRDGRVAGRPKDWSYAPVDEDAKRTDFVFDGGRELSITSGPGDASYYVLDTLGRAEVRGLHLDLGILFCAGNEQTPVVTRISAESPGVLQGQCARGSFGDTDF